MKIAVIGANAPLLPFYKQAKALGYDLYGFAWEEGAVCKEYCTKFYPVSFKEKEEILRLCSKERITGITSFSLESALPTVIHVASRMGLVSNSEECMMLTGDKFTMRERFKECGVPSPSYRKISDKAELDIIGMDYPLIIKPSDSGGSRGVSKAGNKAELIKAFDRAIAFSPSRTAIIEEFVEGREFSVEYISYEGSHHFLQITDKITSGAPYFVELEHHQPADISNEQSAKIRTVVESALNALKITDSPSHTELKMGPDGSLKIIEVGPRMGGDYITSDLVRLSTGYDFVKGNIELITGRFSKPSLSKKSCAGIYFLCSQTNDRIIHYIQNPNQYPWIVEASQDEAIMYATNNSERSGQVIYSADKKIVL